MNTYTVAALGHNGRVIARERVLARTAVEARIAARESFRTSYPGIRWAELRTRKVAS